VLPLPPLSGFSAARRLSTTCETYNIGGSRLPLVVGPRFAWLSPHLRSPKAYHPLDPAQQRNPCKHVLGGLLEAAVITSMDLRLFALGEADGREQLYWHRAKSLSMVPVQGFSGNGQGPRSRTEWRRREVQESQWADTSRSHTSGQAPIPLVIAAPSGAIGSKRQPLAGSSGRIQATHLNV